MAVAPYASLRHRSRSTLIDVSADRLLLRWLWAFVLGLAVIALAIAASGMRRAFFLALFVPLGLAPFAYARWRSFRQLAAALPPGGQRPLLVFGIACDVIMAAQLLSARSPVMAPLLGAPGIDWIGPVWFSAHALALLGFGVVGLMRLAVRPLAWWRARQTTPAATAADDGGFGRRDFLRHASLYGAAAPFALSLTGVPLSYDFRVDERQLTLPDWPAALDGLRIAHLSDIHVGGAMDRARLLHVAALTNAAHPDLVLHTGDFLTHRSGDFDAPLYEALGGIEAPLGQWACLGNHDFDDPERLVRRLREVGVTTLRDALITLPVGAQPLQIGGLDFLSGRTSTAEAARRMADWPARSHVPRLLLNHDPTSFALLPEGCADLVLSGHTHGGHIGIQLGRDSAITVVGLAGLPDQGVFTRGAMRMFVTRCVGFYGYPMRVGIPPEIAIIVLRSPPQSTAL
ncbi:MAG: metallophosphoesterase [bacterium]